MRYRSGNRCRHHAAPHPSARRNRHGPKDRHVAGLVQRTRQSDGRRPPARFRQSRCRAIAIVQHQRARRRDRRSRARFPRRARSRRARLRRRRLRARRRGRRGMAEAGVGNGASAKSSFPSFTTTMRSHQPRAVLTYWRTRQGVEEFIGNQEQRPVVSAVIEMRRPADPRAGCSCSVSRAASRCSAGLASTSTTSSVSEKSGRRLRRAQCVGHQGAAAGPQLHQPRVLGLALVAPDLQHTKAPAFRRTSG